MLKIALLNSATRQALHTAKAFLQFTKATGDEDVLITTDFIRAHGTFKSATRTTGGTTVIASPDPERSIAITDILISAAKTTNSSAAINFTDGTNTIEIFKVSPIEQPIEMSIGISGRLQGWRDARIELVTVSTTETVVTIGYVKLPEGLDFSAWDQLR